jgi:hypothetical protein
VIFELRVLVVAVEGREDTEGVGKDIDVEALILCCGNRAEFGFGETS